MAETKRSPHSIEAIACGTLTALELTQTQAKEGKQPKPYLKAEISACGSKLKVTVFGTKKNPSLPVTLHEQLGIGMKVSARGNIEEQVSEDQRLFRGLRPFGISQADAHDEEKLVYHIAGFLGRLERTGAGELVAPITCVRQYEKDGVPVDQESTLRVAPPEAMLKELYEKCPVGTLVRVRGDIINKSTMKFDRFGVPEGPGEYVSRLDVALLEVWDVQREMWNPLTASGAAAPAQPQQPNQPAQPAAPQQTQFHDDDDVPF
jgi:hypothetical protein